MWFVRIAGLVSAHRSKKGSVMMKVETLKLLIQVGKPSEA